MKKYKNLIIIDAGHGGIDDNGNYTTAPGKMFKHKNGEIAYEGKFNRELSTFIGQIAEQLGYDVVYTVNPFDATDVSLKDRVAIANDYIGQAENAVFISIHGDACKNHNAIGWSIYTTKKVNNSDILAEVIADSVEPYMKNVSRCKFDIYSDGDKDKEVNYYIIKLVNCPSVLLENGFFDNWNDWIKMKDSKHQSLLATYIVEGIDNYFKK